MIFEIDSYIGVGPLHFGMSRNEVHQLYPDAKEFKKSTFSTEKCDLLPDEGIVVYYGRRGCEAIEFGGPVNPQFDNKKLLSLSEKNAEDWLTKNDDDAQLDPPDLTSEKLGVAFFTSEDKVKTVLVFQRGYFEDSRTNINPDEIHKSLQVIEKAFSATREAWIFKFANTLSRYMLHNLDRSLAETMLLSALESEARQAFLDGLQEGGVYEMDDADSAILDRFLVEQIDFIDGLFDQIDAGTLALSDVPLRANMWANKSLVPMLDAGRLSANSNGYYIWDWDERIEQHCSDCKRLNGQIHRMKDWDKHIKPKSSELACWGAECGCRLKKSNGPAQGGY